MKRVWADAEIAEYWFLFPREKELLVNKHGTTRLGFALLLKFFSLEEGTLAGSSGKRVAVTCKVALPGSWGLAWANAWMAQTLLAAVARR